MTDEIGVDPDVVKTSMNRLSTVAETVASTTATLAPSQCVMVPDAVAAFQTAFDAALLAAHSVAEKTQLQLGGSAQQIWSSAEELDAVDVDVADSLKKVEAAALEVSPPLPPASDLPGVPSVPATPASVPAVPGQAAGVR